MDAVRVSLAREGVDPALLEPMAADSDKQRFELSADGARVRDGKVTPSPLISIGLSRRRQKAFIMDPSIGFWMRSLPRA